MKGLIRSINMPPDFCKSQDVAAIIEDIKIEYGNYKVIISYNDYADVGRCKQNTVILISIRRHKTECRISQHKLTTL